MRILVLAAVLVFCTVTVASADTVMSKVSGEISLYNVFLESTDLQHGDIVAVERDGVKVGEAYLRLPADGRPQMDLIGEFEVKSGDRIRFDRRSSATRPAWSGDAPAPFPATAPAEPATKRKGKNKEANPDPAQAADYKAPRKSDRQNNLYEYDRHRAAGVGSPDIGTVHDDLGEYGRPGAPNTGGYKSRAEMLRAQEGPR
ncbi:MAG: hypothetical protein HY319_15060 [Armatimonadetes bacterium]|nr:hypothetical protein [Armatimonadota bacterium]